MDEYKGYRPVKRVLKHDVVHHAKYQYVDEEDPTIHTSTIEGVWSILKRAWYVTPPSLLKKTRHAIRSRGVLEV